MTYMVLDNGVVRAATAQETAEIEARQQVAAQPVPPQEVTRRRGLEALFKMYGLKDSDIEAAIVQHVTDPDEQYLALNEFRTSQTFEYERPLVVFMCTAMQLDRAALFLMAESLP